MASQTIISYYEEKNLADRYFSYRPTYPPFVAEEIVKYLRSLNADKPNGKFDRMLDVGCGSGQATQIFAPYFNSILGIDISAEQLDVARERNESENISFQMGSDTNLPAENESIDYVNCATAAHWMDIQQFVRECERVLKPRGCAAFYLYIVESIQTDPCEPVSNQKELDDEYHDMITWFVKEYKGHPRNNHWIESYRPLFDQIQNGTKRWLKYKSFDIYWTLRDWRKFWLSKGDYVQYIKDEKPEIDPLDVFMEKTKRFLKVEGKQEEDIKIKMVWEIPTIVFTKECR